MTKRILSLVLALVLVMALCSTAFAVTTRYSYCRNGKPLNVRSGPGKEYSVIGSIAYGEPIGVDRDLGNGWSLVVWGSQDGYVMTSLLSKSKPGPYTPQPTPSTNTQTALTKVFETAKAVTAPYLVTLQATAKSKGVANVRWAPSKQAKLQKAYNPGTQVLVLAELDKWYQVQDPETQMVGFVNTAYVKK